jgi:high-affinity Fe2+/Pb2+ permease
VEEKRVGNNANRAAERMSEAIQKSCQAIADNAVALQERNMRFCQDLFWAGNETLRGQAQANREMAQTLAEQTQRQQEALQTLTQESVDAYMSFFLYSAFPYTREGLETARRAT